METVAMSVTPKSIGSALFAERRWPLAMSESLLVTETPQNSQHCDPNLSLSEKPYGQDKGTWGVVLHASALPLGRRGRIVISLRLCCEFRVSLGYTARPCLGKEKKEMEAT